MERPLARRAPYRRGKADSRAHGARRRCADPLAESHERAIQRLDRREAGIDCLSESHQQSLQCLDWIEESHRQLLQEVRGLKETVEQLTRWIENLDADVGKCRRYALELRFHQWVTAILG